MFKKIALTSIADGSTLREATPMARRSISTTIALLAAFLLPVQGFASPAGDVEAAIVPQNFATSKVTAERPPVGEIPEIKINVNPTLPPGLLPIDQEMKD